MEPKIVAYGYDPTTFLCKRQELFYSAQGMTDRLFQENVAVRFEGGFGARNVHVRWGTDQYGSRLSLKSIRSRDTRNSTEISRRSKAISGRVKCQHPCHAQRPQVSNMTLADGPTSHDKEIERHSPTIPKRDPN